MSWDRLIDVEFSGRLCLTLFHSVWQVAALAAAAWAVDRAWGRRSVEKSYALYVTALLVSLAAMPITYAVVEVAAPPAVADSRGAIEAVAPVPTPVATAPDEPSPAVGEVERTANTGGQPPAHDTARSLPVAAVAKEPSTLWLRVAPWIVAFYGVGVLFMLARLIACIWRAWRLGFRAQSIADGVLVDRLNALARTWSMRVVPALARVEQIAVPKVVGLARPTILLPAAAITGLSPDELEMILAHELAHVQRYDMWVNLLQRFAEVALFFNPALWCLSRRISVLREYCCDELTCRATSDSGAEPRMRYASALLRVVEISRQTLGNQMESRVLEGRDVAALAASGRSPSELRRRVAHLFGEPLREPLRISRSGMLAIAGFVLVLLLGPPLWPTGELTAESVDSPAAANDAAAAENDEEEPAGEPTADADAGRGLAVVVARHVLLLDGKEIITWPELEEKIAALPDPTTASPSFYITRGAHEAGGDKTAKAEMWRLHRDYNLRGHSEGSLWPRSDLRYDRIERPSDLVPDASLRIDGRVANRDGEPVGGAEVILITPVDESISYKSYHVTLVRGRVYNRLEHVMTDTDEQGRFSLYPPKNVNHYIVTLHPEAGFALTRGGQLASSDDLKLLPWASLVTEMDGEPGLKQSASLRTRVAESEGWPEVIFNHYRGGLKTEEPTRVYAFTHVPAIFEATVQRSFRLEEGTSIGLSGASVSLLPGETRRLGLGPLSEQQRQMLERRQREVRERRGAAEERDEEADDATKGKTVDRDAPSESSGEDAQSDAASVLPEPPQRFKLQVVGPDAKPVAGAMVEIRTDPIPKAEQILEGTFVRKGPYGAFATADADGRLAVELPARKPGRFNISIKTPGYGPYWAGWDAASHPQPIPSEFVARLEAGWTVGGIVVDNGGAPIEGVTVRPDIQYKKRPGDVSALGVGTRIATDAEGKWSFQCVPDSMSEVHVSFNHPDFKPVRRPLTRSEFGYPLGQAPQAKIALERGLTVTGTVTDESGEPVAGALVRTKFLNDIREATTDERGHYRLVGCEPRMARIVVSAKGRAIDMQEVRVDPEMEPVDFKMQPGGHVRIRVVDEQDNPIPKARIFFQHWRGRIDYFEFDHVSQLADENGVWEWNEAPLDEFKADIFRPGGMQLSEQSLIAREEEYVFRPPRALVVTGKVFDAATKAPIESFRVVPGLRNSDPTIRMNWIPRDSYQASDGQYRIRLKHDYPAHVVRIEADGYQVAISRDIKTDEGEVTIDFQLQPAKDIAATIRTANGEPAAGAKIALGVAGSQISVKNGDMDDGSTYATRLDADETGRFSFPGRDEPFQLVITHPSGFAYLKSTDGPVPSSIALTPWARVEGTFRVGTQTVPNVGITLDVESVHSYGDDVPNIFTHHDVTTQQDGRFVFERVFPGRGRISRRLWLTTNEGATEVTSSTKIAADFPPGETTRIDLGGAGRPVVGELRPPDDFGEKVLWSFALVNVQSDLPAPRFPEIPDDVQADPEKREAWRQQWLKTDEGKAWKKAYDAYDRLRSEKPHFTATVDRDGTFRIDDVPAGDYVLSVRFSEHSAGRLSDYRFSLPPIDGGRMSRPLDLGVLSLEKR